MGTKAKPSPLGVDSLFKGKMVNRDSRARRTKRLSSGGHRSIGRPFWMGFFVFFLFTSCAPKGVSFHRRIATPPCKIREPIKEIPSSPTEKIQTISKKGRVQYGVASWYGPDFHGKPTASGVIYDMYALTAAHQSLPMGTHVMVTNLSNNLSLEVIINDRGPFIKERVIDLSYCAAMILGIIEEGTAKVRLEILDKGPSADRADFNRVKKGYTIQVASFSKEEAAFFLKEALQGEFPDVQIVPFQTSTQRFYRVRIGEFSEKSHAMEVAQKLIKKGYNVIITSLNK